MKPNRSCLIVFLIVAVCILAFSCNLSERAEGQPATDVSDVPGTTVIAGNMSDQDLMKIADALGVSTSRCQDLIADFLASSDAKEGKTTLSDFLAWYGNHSEENGGNGNSQNGADSPGGTVLSSEALAGLFTINEYGDQIRFSRGNLYHTGEDIASGWAFEANQYDYRTYPDPNCGAVIGGTPAQTPSGDIGSFRWAKSTDYALSDKNLGGSVTDTFFANTDGNVMGAEWRALSHSEWIYLIGSSGIGWEGYCREDGDKKAGLATIRGLNGGSGIKGMVLLPDSWTPPSGLPPFIPGASFSANSYSKTQWEAMEAAGAVFLPAAGLVQVGIEVYPKNIGSSGEYWSSTPEEDTAAGAYGIHFTDGYSSPNFSASRLDRFPVRLVTEAK